MWRLVFSIVYLLCSTLLISFDICLQQSFRLVLIKFINVNYSLIIFQCIMRIWEQALFCTFVICFRLNYFWYVVLITSVKHCLLLYIYIYIWKSCCGDVQYFWSVYKLMYFICWNISVISLFILSPYYLFIYLFIW